MFTLELAAKVVAAVGVIAGGAVAVEQRYTPTAEFKQHLAQELAGQVLSLRKELRQTPDTTFKRYLCEELERTLILICDEVPGHTLCLSRDRIINEDCQ